MPDINYVNPRINNISKQEISIQVSLSGFSFLIKSTESKECLLFRNYKFKNLQLVDELIRKIEGILAEEINLDTDFTNTEVIFINQKATLIPEQFFSKDQLRKYFEFNHSLNDLDEIHYSKVSSISAYNVFSLPNYLANIFHSKFSNVNFCHQSSKLINYGSKSETKENNVVIGINSGFFDIAIFEKKNLLLYNSFQFTTALDFIYFFLYPLNQLKINSGDLDLVLLGEVQKHKDIVRELKTKVKSIHYAESDNNQLCNPLSNAQKVEFFNLFN